MSQTARLPDFIIAGAQKSGTTSLHHILAAHPDVYIPEKEVFFFDVDDIVQHPDFFVPTSEGWVTHDFEEDFETYFEWYQKVFAAAGENQLVGEDSTTYLASRLAPGRIARVLPEAKVIALLRNPVNRAYSQYWHHVRTSRARESFERTLRYRPGTMLSRGFYKEQLERYLAVIPGEQLKFVIFEEFIADTQRIVDEICQFIGLQDTVDLAEVDSHRNKARPPLSVSLRLLVNKALGPLIQPSYNSRIPNMPGYEPPIAISESEPPVKHGFKKLRGVLPSRKYPPMKKQTRKFLQSVYRQRNRGISELVGRDVSRFWPHLE